METVTRKDLKLAIGLIITTATIVSTILYNFNDLKTNQVLMQQDIKIIIAQYKQSETSQQDQLIRITRLEIIHGININNSDDSANININK